MGASRALVLPSILLFCLVPRCAGQCAGAWENCSESMCCSTPYFQCIEKNPGGKVFGGKPAFAYAQCRNSNNTDPCPCADPPCVDYKHDYQSEIKIPWTCTQLTGGCSKEFQPCAPGKKMPKQQREQWTGTPCCQWGCSCDYDSFNTSWEVLCKPPTHCATCNAASNYEE